MKTIIFAGPSISHLELAELTTADLAPPIRRGDIDRFPGYEMFVIRRWIFRPSPFLSSTSSIGRLCY